jgi:hypothetical protein
MHAGTIRRVLWSVKKLGCGPWRSSTVFDSFGGGLKRVRLQKLERTGRRVSVGPRPQDAPRRSDVGGDAPRSGDVKMFKNRTICTEGSRTLDIKTCDSSPKSRGLQRRAGRQEATRKTLTTTRRPDDPDDL